MIIVAHRRNARSEIAATPAEQGAEIDIRSRGDDLILVHDAFKDGERFEDWLEAYRHRLLILNPKEDGLETRTLDACKARGIDDLFLLDLPLPTMVRLARQGEHRLAVRVSEYEPIALALAFAGLAQWVWIDCFTRFPIGAEEGRALKAAGFKLCVVSPELQGRWDDREISDMRALIAANDIELDAVCTKKPEAWR